MQNQLRYLKGIAAASKCLIKFQESGQCINEALGCIREAAAVGRVYIYENMENRGSLVPDNGR